MRSLNRKQQKIVVSNQFKLLFISVVFFILMVIMAMVLNNNTISSCI